MTGAYRDEFRTPYDGVSWCHVCDSTLHFWPWLPCVRCNRDVCFECRESLRPLPAQKEHMERIARETPMCSVCARNPMLCAVPPGDWGTWGRSG